MFNQLRQLRENIERQIRKLRNRQCEVPFVVLFFERTGSSHLCSMLGNHKQVVCRQEDFHEVRVSDANPAPTGAELYSIGPETFFRELDPFQGESIINPDNKSIVTHVHNIFSCPVKAAGFKFKFPIQMELYPELLNELKTIGPVLRIVSLSRSNVLKQSVSRQNMLRLMGSGEGHSNLWESNPESKQPEYPFRIDVGAAIEYAEALSRQASEFRVLVDQFRLQSGCQVLDMRYEELIEDEAKFIQSAFEFLGVETSATIYSSVSKVTPDNLEDALSNFVELQQAVQGTQFEKMLNE